MNWENQGNKECPFCRTDATVHENAMERKSAYEDCLCGKFIIYKIVLEDKAHEKILKTDEDKILFSGYLRNNQSSQKNNQPITITEEFIREKLPGILDYCQQIPLDEKISKIKSYIFQKTTSIGKPVQIRCPTVYPLFYLKNSDELKNILSHLAKTKILEISTAAIGVNTTLTIEGFSEIESNLKNYLQSKKVFIACKFETDYEDDLVKTIKAACAACGFDAKRVSDKRHNKDITHKIIADIKQSRFIIADFTGQNNGVYFETGYAMGESKEVIRLVDKKQIKKLHFDTRQFSHIPWEKGKWKELEEDLVNQIKVTILNSYGKTE